MLEILHAPSLAERTTLHVGGTALAEIRLSEETDIHKLQETVTRLGGEVFVLGAGSNILAQDGALPLLLIRPHFMHTPCIIEQDDKHALVQVGAGVRLAKLLNRCAAWNLTGLEGLIGIPGTVGGAVAMNAGSFGHETCACLHSVRIYSPETGIVDIAAQRMHFGYRSFSIAQLHNWFFLIHATFNLTRTSMNGMKGGMRLNFLKKKSTQPLDTWNAGCVFKNPQPDKPAGMLLEQCGFKGHGKGGMRFSPMHANFLINEGTGSATIALELMQEACEAVQTRFGLYLKPEVRILPCM